jgi:hypothetical protein
VLLALILVGACRGGDKREQAIDNGLDLATEMMSGVGAGMAGDQASEETKQRIAEAKAKMKDHMAQARPGALAKCREAVKSDKRVEAALDCVIAAKSLKDMQQCDGTEFMKDM